jgi:hypothetical protein
VTPAELHVCTWNVAGIAERQLDTFIDQLSDNHPWDIVLLQEAFRRTEGIESSHHHVIFTCGELIGGLRCPAILVHERWSHHVKFLGGGVRWLAVEFNSSHVFVSLHLQHRGAGLGPLTQTLAEVRDFLSGTGRRKLIIGMDANTKVGEIMDYVHVGEAVPISAHCAQNGARAVPIHEFLVELGLSLVNTFADASGEELHTRHNWSGDGAVQIDFLAASLGLPCSEVAVDSAMVFSTDHKMVRATFILQSAPVSCKRRTCIKRWVPKSSWIQAAGEMEWDWNDWESMADSWRKEVIRHSARPRSPIDQVMADLLRRHAHALPIEKKGLNKTIWRHRRRLHRQRARTSLREAVQRGAVPSNPSRSKHVNWQKLVGTVNPQTALQEFYEEVYKLTPEEERHDTDQKKHFVKVWMDLRIDMTSFRVTSQRLSAALHKLRRGKGSPDGLTAEMYIALPPVALESLARFFTMVLTMLAVPESWTKADAILLPKVVGATSLSKFRAIACLVAARKILGYLWMQMLPSLRFESFQTGFVKGSQAANGVYVATRAAELSREWDKKIFAVQIDLKKAFDRVRHTAVIDALKLQGASLQCVAIICAILLKSELSMSLGPVCTQGIGMARGLPQGAPESPLIFIMVVELVLRGLRAKWRTRQSGWAMDDLWLADICFADDIVLISSSKKDLKRMLKDTIAAFLAVGLEIGLDKTHWTSWPPKPEDHLRIEGVKIAWEPHLIFVGSVLDFSGNCRGAIDYRVAQAEKTYHRWKPLLLCPWLSLKRRVALAARAVLVSLLWLAETWTVSKVQDKFLNTWGARLMSRVARVRRNDGEDIGQFWRRLHRVGHGWMRSQGGAVSVRRRQQLHRFAGHLARVFDCSTVRAALRTRCLAWWRYRQHRYNSKWDGLHPKRFHCWRWEAQLVEHYGEAETDDAQVDVGWMRRALLRDAWREGEQVFATRLVL